MLTWICNSVLVLVLFDTNMVREGLSLTYRGFWLKHCELRRSENLGDIAPMRRRLVPNAAVSEKADRLHQLEAADTLYDIQDGWN